MWLRSVFLKSLREYRIAIFGWGIGMGLIVVSPMASVAELIKTQQARDQLAGLAATFAWNAAPVAVNTVGGYATFKIGTFIFLIAVWPLLAASRMLRGEEDRGALDVVLTLPRSRTRVAVEKIAAMWTALFAMGLLIGLITFAGGRKFDADFTLTDALLFGINLAVICAVIAGVALLISQFTRERAPAAEWTAGLVLVFVVVDMVHRVAPDAGWVSRFSPVYYYNLSKPLVPSYGVNGPALLGLLLLALFLSGVSVVLFDRRDIGGTVTLPRWMRVLQRSPRATTTLPTGDWSLRGVYARSLRTILWPTLWWTLGIAGFAAWMVFAVQQVESRMSTLLSSSAAQTLIKNLGGGAANISAGFLSAIFSLLPLLLMAFAVTQVNRWSADEQEGRLELLLATPQSRLRVFMGRFAALATATVFIGVITLLASGGAVATTGLTLNGGNLAAATLGMIPLGLLVAAIGYLASGWLRTAADTGLLSFLLLIWFFISFVVPELDWPGAIQRLSALYYYGTPLVNGFQTASMLGVVAVSIVALAMGSVRFARKDIGV